MKGIVSVATALQFNDPVRARIHQNRAIIDDGVTVLCDAALSRHFIIGRTARRQIGAYSDFPVVSVIRMPLSTYIGAETRTRLVSNTYGYSADCCSNCGSRWSSYNRATYSASRGSRSWRRQAIPVHDLRDGCLAVPSA
jgi:hypothetical protein